MKKLIIATTVALGLAGVGTASVAQDQTTDLQDVVVTGEPGAYETYVADLDTGYQLQALVGNTHKRFMQARRAADRSESLRMRGLAMRPLVSVAIDNSSGPGVARQIQLIDADRQTVAIVDVFCKRVAPSGGPRCQLAPRSMGSGGSGQRLASAPAEQLRVAEVELRR